eukprot:CAMPEP_0202969944 /NCGR_PEP_ID=MMETSP1396-20130829/15854_1 /ASSEMBLY_ACC=CAM_ASM_000872 /TAXON_ID= /ORGANISM="Pseudokeronopsis sp., Strain Brazil" /LENGTH=138 /DNA_ID=CAMNT_0049698039 /DNA_START=643 /DNA_END=1059 /DNA_ORIENTATION=-
MWYLTAFIFMSLILYSNYQNSRLQKGYIQMLMEKMERTENMERKWRQSLEQLPNGVIIFEPSSGKVEFMNHYFLKLFKIKPEFGADERLIDEMCNDVMIEVKCKAEKAEFSLTQVLITQTRLTSDLEESLREELKSND